MAHTGRDESDPLPSTMRREITPVPTIHPAGKQPSQIFRRGCCREPLACSFGCLQSGGTAADLTPRHWDDAMEVRFQRDQILNEQFARACSAGRPHSSFRLAIAKRSPAEMASDSMSSESPTAARSVSSVRSTACAAHGISAFASIRRRQQFQHAVLPGMTTGPRAPPHFGGIHRSKGVQRCGQSGRV